MKSIEFVYLLNGKQYNVFVTKKAQRNIYYRLKSDGFHVSCPYLTPRSTIVSGLNQFADRLLKQYEKRNSNYSFEEDFIYLFGERYVLSSLNILNNEELQYFLKKKAAEVITQLVRIKEKEMGIKEPYSVAIRKTVAQFGSNSKKTHKLSFQVDLIHYSREIIESVIIHELAHDFERNHQKEFYNIVYKYCPNYDEVQRKLKKGIHK